MSVLLLARQGKLRLDDDVRKYLPELPAYQDTITIRQLIHHTSGVRDRIDLMTIADRDADEVYKEDDIIELLARQKETNFKPGSRRIFSLLPLAVLARRFNPGLGRTLVRPAYSRFHWGMLKLKVRTSRCRIGFPSRLAGLKTHFLAATSADKRSAG
jgi:CubicO group peptidase (beta-lactamase class C family)